ncbi:MAG: 4Fe-4S binding protein [Spirochaetes bacterium]|jgi:Fe-S-cluster-containing hydrogenase component 2|nr:4Fe-4S binding protein [Spirochaetota bacterium]
MPAKVSKEKCIGCGQCVEVCPTVAISMKDDKAVVAPEECIHCETCIDECAKDAISMK